MNWLDIVIIALLIAGAVMGTKVGIIRAALTTAGIIIGTLLGSQLSDNIAGMFSDLDSDSAIPLVASYAIVITACLAAASVAAFILRKIVYTLFMGWVDKLAGLALGSVAAVGISAAAIMGMANLTYSAEVGDVLAGKVLDSTPDAEKTKKRLESGLTESKLVSVFIDVVDTIPASTMGFVPSNFRSALDVLESRKATGG